MNFLEEFGSAWTWSLAGFIALWFVSLLRKDASVVDFWWGPGFGVIALAFWVGIGRPDDERTLILLILVGVWSVRLGVQLGLRRMREGVEDGRYTDLRERNNPGWWWKSLLMVFVLQAVLQGLIAAPVLAAFAASPVALGYVGFGAIAISIIGILIQTVADTQLDRFRISHSHGALLTSGLRSYVRYPSYLGEIMVWAGFSMLALGGGVWLAPLSVLIVTLLIRYVSGVAVLDLRLAKTRQSYLPYRSKTPALIPDFRLGWGSNRDRDAAKGVRIPDKL